MPNPCMHGGTCEEIDVETAECLCGDGYAGEFCEISDELFSYPIPNVYFLIKMFCVAFT